MMTKNFVAPNMSMALKQVKIELGPDAIILSQKMIDGQVHVVATNHLEDIDFAKVYGKFDHELSPTQKKRDIPLPLKSGLVVESKTPAAALPLYSPKKQEEEQEGLATQIRSDLNLIKELLKNNFAVAKEDYPNHYEMHSAIIKKMYEKGFSKNVVNKIIANLNLDIQADEIWQNVVAELMQLIPFENKELLNRKRLLSFIGPSGSGKTQLIAKELMYLNERRFTKNYAFIFVNQNNLKVLDESKIYGRLFNVSSYYVESLAELENAYQRTLSKDHVFIDFPAFDFNKPSQNYYVEFIKKYSDSFDTNLVFPAGMRKECLHQYVHAHGFMNIDSISITKLDEHRICDEILDYLIVHKLPLRYLSLGPEISDHFMCANKNFFKEYFLNSLTPAVKKNKSIESVLTNVTE